MARRIHRQKRMNTDFKKIKKSLTRKITEKTDEYGGNQLRELKT